MSAGIYHLAFAGGFVNLTNSERVDEWIKVTAEIVRHVTLLLEEL